MKQMKSKDSKDIHEDNCEECTKGIETMFVEFANMTDATGEGHYH